MSSASDPRHRYLIIAGAYKAGTTSLFSYLAAHPQVNPARLKETWFFCPPDVARFRPGYANVRDGLAPYLGYFSGDDARLRLEATPTYLYSAQSAELIAAALPQSQLIVLLREPVARLRSWHAMALLYRWLEPQVGFDEYVQMLRADPRPPEERPLHLRALEHGRYAAYLRAYLERFGAARLRVLWFDELHARPRAVVQELCAWAGLDPAFYEGFEFHAENQAIRIRNERLFRGYVGALRWLRRRLDPPLAVRELAKRALKRIEPLYTGLFFAPAVKPAVSEESLRFLRDYYAADAQELATLLGRPVPWAPQELSPDA